MFVTYRLELEINAVNIADWYHFEDTCRRESTIMLRESSQGESSVMRLRLEGHKKPIRGRKKPITNMH